MGWGIPLVLRLSQGVALSEGGKVNGSTHTTPGSTVGSGAHEIIVYQCMWCEEQMGQTVGFGPFPEL